MGFVAPPRVQIPPSPFFTYYFVFTFCAPLAQLDRASGYGPEGQEFESLRVYFSSPAKFKLSGAFFFLAAKVSLVTNLSLHQQGFFIFLLLPCLIRENLKVQKGANAPL